MCNWDRSVRITVYGPYQQPVLHASIWFDPISDKERYLEIIQLIEVNSLWNILQWKALILIQFFTGNKMTSQMQNFSSEAIKSECIKKKNQKFEILNKNRNARNTQRQSKQGN